MREAAQRSDGLALRHEPGILGGFGVSGSGGYTVYGLHCRAGDYACFFWRFLQVFGMQCPGCVM